LDIIAVHDKLTRLPLVHLKSVMLDHFIAKNAAAHKVNSYYKLAICSRKTHYFRPCINWTNINFEQFMFWIVDVPSSQAFRSCLATSNPPTQTSAVHLPAASTPVLVVRRTSAETETETTATC